MASDPACYRVNRTPFKVQCENSVTLAGRLWHSFSNSSPINLESCPLLVCVHPWSKLGGSSENMHSIAKIAALRGIPAITFDHRGVGESTGCSTIQGMDEVEDVIAVCHYAATSFGAKKIVLVGSSAGSALDKVEEIQMYVALGYVFGCFTRILFGKHFENVLQSKKPKLFIQGSQDAFTKVATLDAYLKRSVGPTTKLIFPDIGHFDLEGSSYGNELVEAILKFITEGKVEGTPSSTG
ncbi:esterase/lipase/thioesterase domain-containing protein [Cardiosporidium cionae]|uniref:Esterase/lipase/thioesterase domain-containing protein n=1 Tax=Cardiosporidium cionae TaxID=476202 RepID=A0ABQ7JG51_9APIC|nr:esterase/lipase/thioesterase domain-containing protein [Cardiosporidium cionae]|eukprot:KAF8822997.1 esterase/lipase/thioesterase domain-containing protein [Cardiosporidium cionae]